MSLINFKNAFHAFFAIITFVCVLEVNSIETHKIVETNNGKVRGIKKSTLFKNIEYYSFKGIPYAKSPTGDLRFKPPEPVEPWVESILDATEHGKSCMQPDRFAAFINDTHSEDCLFLNIYVPADVRPDEKLAVIVYIHGGGYMVGSGNDDRYGPDFLIEQRIIIATLNYRLGVFGFMSFGTPEYSGNMGLKDPQMALKCIHSNVEHFSGDNERITLIGTSAGGSSTHFHMLSSESRKYFRNAIPMSGSTENLWAFNQGHHLNLARIISKDLKDSKETSEELIELLKKTPAKNIYKYGSVNGFFKRTLQTNMGLGPVIEKPDANQPFITDLPSDIYEKTNVDIDAMFTWCSNEFLTFYTIYSDEIYNIEELDRNFTIKLPFKNTNLDFDSPEYKEIAKEIREFYFKDAPINKKVLKQYIKLFSDLNFAYGIDKSARQHASKSNAKTYLMRFSVDTKLNVIKRLFAEDTDLTGAGHGDETCYFFRCEIAQEIYDEILREKNDRQSKVILRAIENTTKLLANFAKYGEPSHDGDPVAGYLPIQSYKMNFLDVTNDGLKKFANANKKANIMWNHIEEIIDQFNRKASDAARDEL